MPARIKLRNLFTWEGFYEPVGKVLEHMAVWPKGPADAVVKIDNLRVADEPAIDLNLSEQRNRPDMF